MLFSSIINYTKKSLRPHGLGDFSVRGVFLQPQYLSFPEGSMYPVLYKLIDKGHITDYKKQVGKRLTRVYYHIEPSGQNRLEELTQEYLKTTQSIQNILNFDFKTQQLEDA